MTAHSDTRGRRPWSGRRLSRRALLLPALLLLAGGVAASVAGARTTASPKVLHWALGSTPRSLFGPTDYNTEGAEVMSLVNQGMLAFGPNNALVPTLASSWKQVSPTKYVYTIRKGVRFSNGDRLTAADVAYSIGLHKQKKVASELGTFFVNVKSVHASGDTVTVVLAKPDGTWKYLPAHIAGYVYESKDVRANLASYGTPQHFPVGTGPYMVKSFVEDSKITLVRNPYYWGKKPYYDEIDFSIIPDANTRLLALQSGQIDGSFALGTQAKRVSGAHVYSFASDATQGLTIDMSQKNPPFDNIHVRRAIEYAIDRQGIVNSVFMGDATPASTVDAPGMFDGVLTPAQIKKGYAAIPTYSFDLAKAKAELAQSPVPDGFTTTLNLPTPGATEAEIGQAVQATLAKIGITLKLNPIPRGARYQIVLNHGANLGLQWYSNAADFPDPLELPWFTFSSDQAVTGGNNSSNFRNAKVDALIADGQATSSLQKAAQDALQVEQIAAQNAAFVAFEWFPFHAATRSSLTITGLTPFYYDTIWVNLLRQS
jgi:peptide/nickel transport system substrate-binding protein